MQSSSRSNYHVNWITNLKVHFKRGPSPKILCKSTIYMYHPSWRELSPKHECSRAFPLNPASWSAIHSASLRSFLSLVPPFSCSSLSMQSGVFYGCHSMSHAAHHGYASWRSLISLRFSISPLTYPSLSHRPSTSTRPFSHISLNSPAPPLRLSVSPVSSTLSGLRRN